MNISGTLVFNPNSQPDQPSSNQPIANIPIALQQIGDTSTIGAVTETGVVTVTNTSGAFTFTDVPEGEYRVVEAYGYTGTISTDGSWTENATITVTPNDPPITAISNPPAEATNVNSISPNTIFVLIEGTTDIIDAQFVDAPVDNVPLQLNTFVTIGNNLITAADNGTFGTLPNGTPVQTSNATGSPPYSDFSTSFVYTQYQYFSPTDGQYSISNTIANTNFGTWFNTSDHTTGNETGRMMIVNGSNPGQFIFSTTITVAPNTDYVFYTWIMNVDSEQGSVLPQLRATIEGSTVIYDQLLSGVLSVTAIPTWRQVGTTFNSGDNSTLLIELISEGGSAGGNDYLIDDLAVLQLQGNPVTNLNKQASQTVAEPGDTLGYTINFSNTSSQDLTDVIFTDPIPANTTVVSGSLVVNGVEQDAGLLETGVPVGTLSANESATITFSVLVDSNLPTGTIISNTGTIAYSFVDATGVTRAVTSNSNAVTTFVINSNTITGPTGPTGPAGSIGLTGPTGPTGLNGPIGPTGENGTTGPIGPAGSIGPTGPTGPTGAIGPVGPIGATGQIGLNGSPGPTGPTGSPGLAGQAGATGATGATGERGPRGLIGPIGPIGLAGQQGATGARGPAGPQGSPGPMGVTGPTGATGPTGQRGARGIIGPTGVQGVIGPTGPAGEIGATGGFGPTGPAGPAVLNNYVQLSNLYCSDICVEERLPLGIALVLRGTDIRYNSDTREITLGIGQTYYVSYHIIVFNGNDDQTAEASVGIVEGTRIYLGSISKATIYGCGTVTLSGSVLITAGSDTQSISLVSLSSQELIFAATTVNLIQIS